MKGVKSGDAASNIYDVVVIGSGIGGLVSASLIARSGKRVLVLEKHSIPGGNVTSFTRRGWTFDVGLHYVGECGPGERLSNIFKACGIGDVEFCQMSEDLEEVAFPNFRFAIPSTKRLFYSRLVERFPDEKKGIDRFFKLLDQYDKLSCAMTSGFFLRIVAGLVTSPLLLRYARKTIGEFIDSCIMNPEIKMILNARSTAYAVAPGRVSAILYAGLQNHYLKSGGWYPKEGSQKISDRLTDEIKACGGDVCLRCTVSRIEVKDGRVTGVVYTNRKGGEEFVSTNNVVSNADFKHTVFKLVGRGCFPSKFSDRIERFEMAIPLFITFLGVDIPPKRLSFGNSNQWIVNHADTDAYFDMIERGEFPENPAICISTPSLKTPGNPNVAPLGKTGLEIMTMVPSQPGFWGLTEEEITTGEYRKNPEYCRVKQHIENACIDQAGRLIPGLRDSVVYRESATPMTHTRYVGSTSGTGYGFAAIPSQFLNYRPGAKSPISGLFFAGTNCQNGHGIIGAAMSGVSAAHTVIGNGTFKDIFHSGN
jgi:all-trans-retinol 13,14-reductase